MKTIKNYAAALIVISAAIGMMGCKPEVHVHTFETDWTTDSEYHWHKAKCEHTEEVSDKLLHSYGEWNVTKEAAEDAEGSKERECSVCGYKDTDVIPKKSHVHGSATTWIRTPATHEEKYDCCGAEKTEQSVHTWNHTDYQYDSTSKKDTRTCTVCDYIDEKVHAHTEENSGAVTKNATTTSAGVKTYKCTICNEDTRKELYCGPLGDDGNPANASSTYVYFGVFPKTIKKSSVTINEAENIIMGANTYYIGSDGEWYAKVTAKPYDTSYTYSDTTTIIEGNTDYFKVEPIKWKVLTTDYNGTKKALLLAEDILTARVPYYVSTSDRTINSKTVYANNYMYSTIRAYLNGKYESGDTQTATYNNAGFLQTAFTEDAQTLIANTTVVNNGASTSDATGKLTKSDGSNTNYPTNYTCANTTDKIFLLSEQEATTTAYGFSVYTVYGTGNARIRKPTDYAKANYAYQITISGYGGWWWLRSPGYANSGNARGVRNDGYAYYTYSVGDGNYGVVPALSISF